MIYGVTRYTKRNGLEGWVSIVRVETSESMAREKEREIGITEHGPKYKEKDWTKRDLRGVQIYEEEWTGGVRIVECVGMG